MSKTRWRTVQLVLTLSLFLPVFLIAGTEKKSTPQKPAPKGSKATRTPNKLPLRSIMLINTAETAKKVAEQAAARAQTSKGAGKSSNRAGANQEADGPVLEFRPINDTSPGNSGAGPVGQMKGNKPVLKNIHGSMYGVAASKRGQATGEGGAVGADSRNGKFNIYVEGEHAHASTPSPH